MVLEAMSWRERGLRMYSRKSAAELADSRAAANQRPQKQPDLSHSFAPQRCTRLDLRQRHLLRRRQLVAGRHRFRGAKSPSSAPCLARRAQACHLKRCAWRRPLHEHACLQERPHMRCTGPAA